MKGYKTVRGYAFDEFYEKRSRFIGYAAPVSSEPEAQALIGRIEKENRGAAHNVFAYLLREGQVSRCSDDGEPQGTGGVPVLEVLQREGVTDACVVVTRYFGGILLGTGGLARAYSRAAQIALTAAGVVDMLPCSETEVICDYSFYGKLSYLLPKYEAHIKESSFEDAVRMSIQLPLARFEEFFKEITEQSGGKVVPRQSRTFFGEIV